MIKPCTCSHEYQDKQYGPGMRSMNKCKDGYRCTVCAKEHLSGGKVAIKPQK